MKQAGSMADPLWFKDAVIYELHVRAFMDSNNDGIGDFAGLMQKLDYVQDLGVTCLWLLPFFPSPLRDDGYDISDYLNVNPSYGTLDDFKAFLAAAHERGIQVMVELVVNHTSDQHPWFERARRAPKGSPERAFYVWSDTDQLYKDARIIFTDTEKSNWSWDPVAEQYYWHRFFSHQPDLNYDNPLVMKEILDIMRYWLDMGVDGLRIDAIPYLVERDGTNCENLPETHAVMKKIRAEIDKDYEGRIILAEANQWPADVRPYFGDGDECHMAFHFPLMPRMYMALRQEDALPITEIMAQTPDIPPNCQWGIFLRNHDELTLEMVSDEERDYMYFAYSADPRMRINIGIRRRLAPLVDNNRRRIELLNSLLFSFPGTPILYYGDEIGMGDNIYLGDRNGVRTPMQWTGDRNAGFSRAVPAKLFSPVVMDPVWGYEAINVEAQQSDPSSLLSWMRNMIALRKLFRVFGRGSLKFLHPSNRKVLAYVREDGDERVLCVANLSRFPQPAQLDLSEYAGLRPVEMLGYVEFPKIEKAPYAITLSQYGFLWLELQGELEPEEPEVPADSALRLQHAADWKTVLAGAARERLEQEWLPAFLPRQRWFGAKSRQITATAVLDWGRMGDHALVLVEVTYAGEDRDTYFVPLAVSIGAAGESVSRGHGAAVLAAVTTPDGSGYLHDAMFDDEAARELLALIGNAGELAMQHGTVHGLPSANFAELRGQETLEPRRGSAEQSNTSILFGSRLILKLFRRQQPGTQSGYGDRAVSHRAHRISRYCAIRRRGRVSTGGTGGRGGRELHAGHAAGAGAERGRWMGVDTRRGAALLRAGLGYSYAGGAFPARQCVADGDERATGERLGARARRDLSGCGGSAGTAHCGDAPGVGAADQRPGVRAGADDGCRLVGAAHSAFGTCECGVRCAAAEPVAPARGGGGDERAGVEPAEARGRAAGPRGGHIAVQTAHACAWGLPSRTGTAYAW